MFAETKTPEDPETTLSPTIGQLLRTTRELKGISIDSVANILCISKRQLKALEEDNETLVCDVYTLGFLKSYSQFLGLNGDEIVQKFKDKSAHPHSPRLTFPAPVPGRGMPSLQIIGLSVVAIIAIIAGWEWYGYNSAAPIVGGENFNVTQATEPVTLSFKDWTIVEIKDQNGNVILSKEFYPNETYEIKDPKELTLKTGNPQGVQIKAGDKDYVLLSNHKDVDIPLDPEKWLEQTTETQ